MRVSKELKGVGVGQFVPHVPHGVFGQMKGYGLKYQS